MGDAVKEWNYDKPFTRINNDAFLPKLQLDGDGAARGCQIPSQFPDREKEFNKAYKDFKPGELQKVLQKARDVAKAVDTGLSVATVVGGLLSFGAGTIAAIVAGQKIDQIITKILDFLDKEITELLRRIGVKLVDRALRVIPQWVPVVDGAGNDSVTPDQVVEVEGLAARSFQDPVDVPFRQWHLWFDWNVYLIPEDKYLNVLSPAHNPPNTVGIKDTERPIAPEFSDPGPGIDPQAKQKKTIELQWDSGALWRADKRAEMEQGFNDTDQNRQKTPDLDGPMHELTWAWPQKDSYVWAAGRWVYDCSRTTIDDPPKMCAMLNPCKATATARWQAFQFPENKFPVPAIQFIFFACKRGGYIDYGSIQDQDYDFIVDLPKIDAGPRPPFPIGHTPDYAYNTIVLRPRLLKHVDQNPYNWAGTAKIEPIVEVIRPDDPKLAPSQVKVKVPLTSLPANSEACGFILSLGWFDPFFEQAKKVKACKVTVKAFSGRRRVRDSIVEAIRRQMGDDETSLKNKIHDEIGKIELKQIANQHILVQDIPIVGNAAQNLGADIFEKALDLLSDTGPFNKEEWLFRIAVNGQWHAARITGVTQSETRLTFSPVEFNVLLSEDDILRFSVNGADFDPVGRFMRDPAQSRQLKVDGKAPPWTEIVSPDPDPTKAKDIRQKMAIEYALRLLSLGSAGMGLALDNQPLGFLDPGEVPTGTFNPDEFQNNPVALSRMGDVSAQAIEQKPFFARTLPPPTIPPAPAPPPPITDDQKILVEDITVRPIGDANNPDDDTSDYSIFYDLEIKRQKIPK